MNVSFDRKFVFDKWTDCDKWHYTGLIYLLIKNKDKRKRNDWKITIFIQFSFLFWFFYDIKNEQGGLSMINVEQTSISVSSSLFRQKDQNHDQFKILTEDLKIFTKHFHHFIHDYRTSKYFLWLASRLKYYYSIGSNLPRFILAVFFLTLFWFVYFETKFFSIYFKVPFHSFPTSTLSMSTATGANDEDIKVSSKDDKNPSLNKSEAQTPVSADSPTNVTPAPSTNTESEPKKSKKRSHSDVFWFHFCFSIISIF